MTVYAGTQPSTAPRCDHAYLDIQKVSITANLTTADEVVLAELPSGILLTDLEIRNTDLDSGTALTGTVGHKSMKNYPSDVNNASYFSAAFTQFQAASAGYVPVVFEPKKFNDITRIVFKPTAGGTGTGTIWVKVRGIKEGPSL